MDEGGKRELKNGLDGQSGGIGFAREQSEAQICLFRPESVEGERADRFYLQVGIGAELSSARQRVVMPPQRETRAPDTGVSSVTAAFCVGTGQVRPSRRGISTKCRR